MADRGQYRGIRRVLLDGPDFQMLGPAARWVFVAMKINLGPCGIEVEYPDALVARLASQTGHDIPTIIAALDELERDGWIQREANVVWVVGQLEHDPALKASNPKHVASVRDHIKGLPRIGIIGLFLDKYRRWFDMESDPKWFDNLRQKYPKGIEKAVQWLSDAYRMPMDSPSDQKSDTRDTTEDRRPNSETEKLSDSNESDAGAVRKKLYTDRAALMGVVREVCYAPDGKPREPRGDATDADILTGWLRKGRSPEEIERAIRGVRLAIDANEIDFAPPKQKFGLKILNHTHSGARHVWEIALDAYGRDGVRESAKRGRSGFASVAELLPRRAS
jgi:hypothetical protein